MNEKIINKESRRYAQQTYNDSENWKNFARRITRNDFARNYILDKYHHRCQGCGRPLSKYVNLHHTTYMHCCVSSETIKAHHATPKHPDGIRTVPDCKSCHTNNPDAFEKCTSLIVPVCLNCNREMGFLPKSKGAPRQKKPEKHEPASAEDYIIEKVKKSFELADTFPEFIKTLSIYGLTYDESRKYNRFILSEEKYFELKGTHSKSSSLRTKRGKSIGEQFTAEALHEHFEQ